MKKFVWILLALCLVLGCVVGYVAAQGAAKDEGEPVALYDPENVAAAEETPAAEPAPADGELIAMEDIPDPAFSSGTLGRCFGILPDKGSIFSPCSGTIVEIAETKHAVTISDEAGKTVLIHVGIDTVSLGGKPYTIYGKVGDRVTEGQKIMDADLDMIRKAGLSPMVVVVRCK